MSARRSQERRADFAYAGRLRGDARWCRLYAWLFMRKRLLILGSTGSIGTQALDVVAHVNALHAAGKSQVAFDVVGLAAGRNAELLAEQARRFGVREVACVGNGAGDEARGARVCDAGALDALRRDGVRVREGEDAAELLVREVACDVVLAAIVGIAGLWSTLAAVELGRTVALANKETLVAGGELVTRACAKSGSRLLPVDSEHAALFQALLGATREPGLAPPMVMDGMGGAGGDAASGLDRVTLTASGGPFRTWDARAIADATPEAALKHPTWRMGAKVTIDSASLMNKGLEVIEAHWLFGLSAERIGVLVHPQSIVHAMVHMRDGSVVMACAKPDMRTPIQQALTWPMCFKGAGRALAAEDLTKLEFSPPDVERFPCLALAYRALKMGGGAGAVLNAANEEAVGAFLGGARGTRGTPRFGEIAELVAMALDRGDGAGAGTLEEIVAADRLGREVVREALRARSM